LDDCPVDAVLRYEKELFAFVTQKHPSLIDSIEEKKALDDSLEAEVKKVLDAFNQSFKA
jgi:F-type H+-transporting ATPase subunit alpha